MRELLNDIDRWKAAGKQILLRAWLTLKVRALATPALQWR